MEHASTAASWEPDAPTRISGDLTWTAKGIEEGQEEGRIFGPQKYFKIIAYVRHPEIEDGSAARIAYVEGFLIGLVAGIMEYTAERAQFDDEPEPETTRYPQTQKPPPPQRAAEE